MSISQATLDLISAAVTDRDAAKVTDDADTAAQIARDAAIQAELKAKATSIDAHQKALDSAHVAINALTAELSGASPVTPPVTPPAAPNALSA